VHLTGSIDDLDKWMTQVNSGLIPADPFLLIGQMTTADPTRSPTGTEALWAYTHVPHHVSGDAGSQGITGRWDKSDAQRMADRMQQKIEHAAPDSPTGSSPGASSHLPTCTTGTPTSSAAPSTAAPPPCTNNSSSGPSQVWDGPKPPSSACTSDPRPHTPAAASTALAAPTPPEPHSPTTGSTGPPGDGSPSTQHLSVDAIRPAPRDR
jgi:hypothetical protein